MAEYADDLAMDEEDAGEQAMLHAIGKCDGAEHGCPICWREDKSFRAINHLDD